MRSLKLFATWWLIFGLLPAQAAQLFPQQNFGTQDAVSVRDAKGKVLYQWQPDKPLIPASLSKLLTADLAIDKWGIEHHFVTEFYLLDQQLWIRGLADPFLVSEELEIVATHLHSLLPPGVNAIMIDTSYMAQEAVPGRTGVADPYNAPLSGVAANFNTVQLKRSGGVLESAEPQTPLTNTAQRLARQSSVKIGSQATRINLVNADNAQQHFAELLSLKLAQQGLGKPIQTIKINQSVPDEATLILRHQNTRTLADVLRGTLEYSNNFIANQLFLLLSESPATNTLSFSRAQRVAQQAMDGSGYQSARLLEGSGLSRANRINARDMHKVLEKLAPHRTLLKRYDLTIPGPQGERQAVAFAKTGTLDGIRTYAGYLELGDQDYQFVFMFNRPTPYKYREQLLQSLASQLAKAERQ